MPWFQVGRVDGQEVGRGEISVYQGKEGNSVPSAVCWGEQECWGTVQEEPVTALQRYLHFPLSPGSQLMPVAQTRALRRSAFVSSDCVLAT